MELLRTAMEADPAAPRLTIYNETTGTRLDFSALTLDNWAAKVGNMLLEEFDLEPGDTIAIDLAPSWQATAISLGALAAGMSVHFGSDNADVLFTSLGYERDDRHPDVAIVTNDPFGRGVAEIGAELPEGCVDFGPTVRFYGDQFYEPTAPLADLLNIDVSQVKQGERLLSTGWHNWDEFVRHVLVPIATGGSAVVVSGPTATERLEKIAQAERITERVAP
ncbi:TIGR03089 family protein [Corynebacterium sp. H128]|uniref:TIGR03089 family protein n=1 Tax=Corynebacterium sp. H128 TaxID=3133427 RepID=UPI0030B445CF